MEDKVARAQKLRPLKVGHCEHTTEPINLRLRAHQYAEHGTEPHCLSDYPTASNHPISDHGSCRELRRLTGGGLRTLQDHPKGAAVTKIVKILVLVAILTVTLAVSPAQACACGEDWSAMSAEEIVSAINGAEDEPRIMAGQSGQLPPAPPGYQYDATYRLVPL